MTEAVAISEATAGDAAEIAALYLASRADALPGLRRIHSDDQVRIWVRDVLLAQGTTWVARSAGVMVGFMTLLGDELDQLYLLPGQYRRGIGRQFLMLAKRQSPRRLRLFTFQRNARARAFYEAHGFQIVSVSDGSRNEEAEPDVCYEWQSTRLFQSN
jgi:GNAT superfamily N-acetyltransferase